MWIGYRKEIRMTDGLTDWLTDGRSDGQPDWLTNARTGLLNDW